MITTFRCRTNKLARALTVALLLPISAGLMTPRLAHAQEPAAEGGDSSGRPLDGYLATACLAGFVLFIVAKSARR